VEMRNVHTILAGKPEGRRPLKRFRRKWEDNIKIGLKRIKVSWLGMDSFAQDRVRCGALLEHGNEASG
jgi:hypothetical protein